MVYDTRRRAQRTAGWATLVGGTCVLAFWAIYFTSDAALGHGDPAVTAFEAAFLLADAVFALTLFAAGVFLLRDRRPGTFFLVAAAAMSIYLALLDVAFYARQGLYLPLNGSAALELVVNALCLIGGALGLRWGWILWSRRTA
ncbi:MAG: hypothetical protein OER21_14980 [Gemmatimonadota bacterium]|nr:hypothetical protein [Gemmatimonadota bacterium]